MSQAAWRPAPPLTSSRRGSARSEAGPRRTLIGLPHPRDARPRPRLPPLRSASARGSGLSGAEWARARRWGRAGARGAGLAACQRSLPSMRTETAGGAARRPQKPRSQAAAPACRGTWRSPQSAERTPGNPGSGDPPLPTHTPGPAAPPQPCDAGRACEGTRVEGRGTRPPLWAPPAQPAQVWTRLCG